jgi:uncharacterized membrane protein YbhN (UPF0104 family)
MKKDGVQTCASTICILVVTISYQLAMLLVCLFSLIIRFDFVNKNLGVLKYFTIFGVSMIFLFIAIFLTATFHNNLLDRFLTKLIRIFARFRLIKHPDKAILSMELNAAEYRSCANFLRCNPKLLLFSLLMLIVKLTAKISVTYAVYKALGLSGFGFLDILALQAFLALAVEYVPLPGSVGATEAAFIAINRIIFGHGKLFPALLLSRGISFYVFLIISGIVSLAAHISTILQKPKIETKV